MVAVVEVMVKIAGRYDTVAMVVMKMTVDSNIRVAGDVLSVWGTI